MQSRWHHCNVIIDLNSCPSENLNINSSPFFAVFVMAFSPFSYHGGQGRRQGGGADTRRGLGTLLGHVQQRETLRRGNSSNGGWREWQDIGS